MFGGGARATQDAALNHWRHGFTRDWAPEGDADLVEGHFRWCRCAAHNSGVFLLLFGGGCLVPVVVLAGRSGRLASAYLTGQLGRPVHIRVGKLGIRWWQHRVDQEMLGA
jgi:hypothetical protein